MISIKTITSQLSMYAKPKSINNLCLIVSIEQAINNFDLGSREGIIKVNAFTIYL